MGCLDNWDFVEVFSGTEAAALMVGLDPTCDKLEKIRPVLQCMEQSYTKTLLAHKSELWLRAMERAGAKIAEIEDEDNPYVVVNLHSWRMRSYYKEVFWDEQNTKMQEGLAELSKERFQNWLLDDLRNSFGHQLFQRAELGRWLKANSYPSVYQFSKSQMLGKDNPESQSASFIHSTLERRDLLTPAIEVAQSKCRNNLDASEVWAKLKTMAHEKYSPLIGIDESGIQYLDANEQLRTLSLRALRMRLFRAR